MQRTLDAGSVSSLFAPAPSVVRGSELASIRIGVLVENGFKLFERDVRAVAASFPARIDVPDVAVLAHPTSDGHFTNVEFLPDRQV